MHVWSKEAYLDMNPQSLKKIDRKALYVEQAQALLAEAVGREVGCWWGKAHRIVSEMKMFTKCEYSLSSFYIRLTLPFGKQSLKYNSWLLKQLIKKKKSICYITISHHSIHLTITHFTLQFFLISDIRLWLYLLMCLLDLSLIRSLSIEIKIPSA